MAFSSFKSVAMFGMCSVVLYYCGLVGSHASILEKPSPPLGVVWNQLNKYIIPEGEFEDEAPFKYNMTAEATFSNDDVTLVERDHGNATVYLIIRGYLTECINITFTYEPRDPSIEPLENITHFCPENLLGIDNHYDKKSGVQSQDEYYRLQNTEVHFRTLEFYLGSLGDVLSMGDFKEGHNDILSASPLLLNKSMELVSRWVGKTIIHVNIDPPIVNDKYAFIRVSVIHNPTIEVVGDIFGWVYSIIWDISFLPQVWLNWNRKSVIGFSFDNVVLNIVAYFCYGMFNVALFFIPAIKRQFQERYPTQVNHVQPNDVFFALYGLGIEIVLGIQCCIYERAPGQKVSYPCIFIVVASFLTVIISCILVPVHVFWWLDVFYVMSYLKLIITPLKYIPQLYINYKLKSTAGFSMVGLLMDFTGGVMSLAQMFMLSANSDDWKSIFTNFSKFGLGVMTIIFDLCFFLQHYLYHLRGSRGKFEVKL